jgi:hypothetical protein
LPGLILAQATSDNAPEGAYFTLWFPLGLFIIVAAILWVLYARPHRRVPPRRRPAHAHAGDAGPGSSATGSRPAGTSAEEPGPPREPGPAREPGGPGEPGGPQEPGGPPMRLLDLDDVEAAERPADLHESPSLA